MSAKADTLDFLTPPQGPTGSAASGRIGCSRYSGRGHGDRVSCRESGAETDRRTQGHAMKRPGNGEARVLRGGACYIGAVRSAYRKVRNAEYRGGFRVVCEQAK